MARRIILALLVIAGYSVIAAPANAAPPDKLQPPVFSNCDDRELLWAPLCADSIVHEFKAYIPNQPHAQGRVRYRLVRGCGEIDEKTGRWVWYPQPSDTMMMYTVIASAYIHNTDIETPPEGACRMKAVYRDRYASLIWVVNGDTAQTSRPVYHVTAPGTNVLPYCLQEPDQCDEPIVSIVKVYPPPAGTIEFADTALVASLSAADMGRKFAVTYELVSGSFVYQGHVILDTREDVLPVFVACPAETLFVPVCSTLSYQLRAVDPDWPDQPAGIEYSILPPRGLGGVGPYTGEFRFTPRDRDAGRLFQVEVVASYGDTMTTGDQNCRFWVQVGENHPPEFVNSPCSIVTVAPPDANGYFHAEFEAVDPDGCRPVRMFLDEVSPAPVNGVDFTTSGFPEARGRVQMWVTPEEYGQGFSIRVGATDGRDTTYCEFGYMHLDREPMKIAIERAEWIYNGARESIEISVNRNGLELRGFNLTLGYDATPLAFQGATAGSIYDSCGWEYFTYYHGSSEVPCEGDCPSGLINLVGIAEVNGGDKGAAECGSDTSFTLASLGFRVTDDRSYTCRLLPIRFLWMDCGDNVISGRHWMQLPFDEDQLISRRVFEMDSAAYEDWGDDSPVDITQLHGALPGYGGARYECDYDTSGGRRLRLVDFFNGGIQVAGADGECNPYLYRCGDIDFDGECHAEGDFQLFRDYLEMGPSALPLSPEAHAEASDVNFDSLTWTVADYIRMENLAADGTSPRPVFPNYLYPIHVIAASGSIFLTKPDSAVSMLFKLAGDVEITPVTSVPVEAYFHEDVDETWVLVGLENRAPLAMSHLFDCSPEATILHAEAAMASGRYVAAEVGSLLVGDLNLDGYAATIADVTTFSNFLGSGIDIFPLPTLAMRASDFNGDGYPLEISDDILMIRHVVGELPASAPSIPGRIRVTGRFLQVDTDGIAGLHIVFAGQVEARNLYRLSSSTGGYDPEEDVTRVVVLADGFNDGMAYPQGKLFELSRPATIISASAGTPFGGRVELEIQQPPSAMQGASSGLPTTFAVHQNHPNPFNLETVISFDLPEAGTVRFEVFNVLGQMVYGSAQEYPAGYHQLGWDGRTNSGKTSASGVYLYRIAAGEGSETKKMLLLK